MSGSVKAIGLISGGLDSTLAAAVLKDMGVDVIGLNFSTGFCKVDHRRAINDPREDPERLRNPALRAGAVVGFPVEIIDVAEAYLDVVRNPRYGYGANVNPCIDCRIFMLIRARQVMEQRHADLVFTGEVLGQRPMSQHRRGLRLVEEQAGLAGRLLRPLSAGFLDPTIPERQGRLDRARLLSIQGRSRKAQMDLAERLAVNSYPQPSGGCCFLADPNFARRFRDLVNNAGQAALQPEDTTLLKVGRHFRLDGGLKLVTGRNEGENGFLRRLAGHRWVFEAADGVGPLGLAIGEPEGADRHLMASIVARYMRVEPGEEIDIVARRGTEEDRLRVRPAEPDAVERHLI